MYGPSIPLPPVSDLRPWRTRTAEGWKGGLARSAGDAVMVRYCENKLRWASARLAAPPCRPPNEPQHAAPPLTPTSNPPTNRNSFPGTKRLHKNSFPGRPPGPRALAVPSSEPVTKSCGPRRSGQQELTMSVCSPVFLTCSPVCASHRRDVLSGEHDSRCSPSGVQCSSRTAFLWPAARLRAGRGPGGSSQWRAPAAAQASLQRCALRCSAPHWECANRG